MPVAASSSTAEGEKKKNVVLTFSSCFFCVPAWPTLHYIIYHHHHPRIVYAGAHHNYTYIYIPTTSSVNPPLRTPL